MSTKIVASLDPVDRIITGLRGEGLSGAGAICPQGSVMGGSISQTGKSLLVLFGTFWYFLAHAIMINRTEVVIDNVRNHLVMLLKSCTLD